MHPIDKIAVDRAANPVQRQHLINRVQGIVFARFNADYTAAYYVLKDPMIEGLYYGSIDKLDAHGCYGYDFGARDFLEVIVFDDLDKACSFSDGCDF